MKNNGVGPGDSESLPSMLLAQLSLPSVSPLAGVGAAASARAAVPVPVPAPVP